MDSLPEDEIEAIWGRIDVKLPLNEVKAKNKSDAQNQVKQLMLSSFFPKPKNARPQQTIEFLVKKGFVERAFKNDRILSDVFRNTVSRVKVRGKERFIIKKGSPSFSTKTGKVFRAGQFLKGNTQEEALQDFVEKTKE